jgi:hypothetical protein
MILHTSSKICYLHTFCSMDLETLSAVLQLLDNNRHVREVRSC